MEGENETVQEVKDAIEVRDEIIEHQSETIAAVIAEAQERVDETQEQAAAIVEAAMETNLGREIAALREENREWHEKVTSMSSSLETMQQQMTEMGAAIAVLAQPITTPAAEQSSSIPQTLETLPPEVTEVIPEPLQKSAEENPVPQAPVPPKRIRNWI